MKTVTPHRTRMMHHRRMFSRHAHISSNNAHALAQAQDESHLSVRVILQSRAILSCPITIPWACLANPVHFPTLLETELGANCADSRGGSLLVLMPAQNLLAGEPDNLIEISSVHTPINLVSRRRSSGTDLNDVPTTVAASDVTEIHDERQLTSPLSTQEREVIACPFCASVHQEAAASSSQHHRVSQICGKC